MVIEVLLGAFATDALQEKFAYLKRWAQEAKIEMYNGVPIVRVEIAAPSAARPMEWITCPATEKQCNDFCDPGKGDRCAESGEAFAQASEGRTA